MARCREGSIRAFLDRPIRRATFHLCQHAAIYALANLKHNLKEFCLNSTTASFLRSCHNLTMSL
ncbi:hypothetical protein RHIZ404_220355 [Rhizobium sp. EC-SD404]|nr:hypothetical protein RHIZ404_220355 [Rhizobium sp. EC-SD404]